MIIIGDNKSSNTKKLYKTSKKFCEKALLIQSVDDLYHNIDILKK